MFMQALMGADADAQCNADYGQRTPERTNSRNGYRPRSWTPGPVTIDLAVPKLRSGSYFPEWLLEPRKRAEKALTSVVATCYCWAFRPVGWTDLFNPWGSRVCPGRRCR